MMRKFILLVVFFLSIKSGQFQRENVNDEEFLQSSDPLLSKFWGIQDVTTSVGKLFRYKIPSDAFKGTILYYDVIGEENAALPNWMMYDKKSAIIEGVPSISDIGDTRITVKAYDNKGQSVGDMFVVEVYPLWEKNTNNKRKCKKGEGVMMISLVIEKNFNDITPKQKVTALKNLAHYLHFSVSTLLFLPSKETLEISSDSLVFEKNIQKDADLNSSIITWQIGCKEKIWAEKLQVVELVEKYVNDKTFNVILQLPVIGWHITSSFNPFRTRRNTPQNNGLSDLDSKDGIDDDGDDEDDVEGEDEELDDENASNENLIHDTASPVLSGMAATRLLVPNSSNPTHSNQKPIIDSAISNQTSERLNISPNPTTSLLSSEGILNEEDTTELNSDNEDAISFGQNSSPTSELPTIQTNLTSAPINVTSVEFSSTEKSTTLLPKRYPPRVERNLDQIRVEAGKPYKIKIPEDIFIDAEDGNTRNLTLRLIKTDNCSVYTPWIELNVETQELYILASLDTISKHEFFIEATDSDNMSSTNSLIVNVQYPPNARTINFEISLHMKLREIETPSVFLQFNLLNEIARLYNDANTNKITVRNVTCNPFVFTWANNTLSSQSCDNKTIFELLNVLTHSPGSMDIKKDAYRDFETNVSVIVEKVTWRGTGLCNEVPPPRLPQSEKQNFKPMVRNRIDNLTATVGELKVFRIPEDTFFDPEEPNGRNLKLSLLTMDHLPVPSDNWLQFDSNNQEFYGLPMANDVGTVKYQLVCDDNQDGSENMKARHVIEVVVEPATKAYYNVEFRMKLSTSYEEFVRSPLTRRTFVERLAKLFGDKNTSSIVVSGFSPGSLIVTWHNKSLPFNECKESEIVQLRKVLLNEDHKLEENVNKVLKPEFEALSVDITPTGICEGGLTEVHPLPPEVNTGSQEIHAIIFNNVYFMNSILPIVIIVIMIFVAGLIACLLYRRQRRAKWTLGDEDERRSFRNKGIPVIFQDELEERLEPSNKSPIIMKEEKPPLPPPEYQKVAPMATTALLSDFDDPSYQQGSGTYSSRSTERNGRSKPTPIYRKPPPYVPQ